MTQSKIKYQESKSARADDQKKIAAVRIDLRAKSSVEKEGEGGIRDGRDKKRVNDDRDRKTTREIGR